MSVETPKAGAETPRAPAPPKQPSPASRYEPCEECGAPMDPQQRYCVNCAARRGNGANPASRYFAAMSKKTKRAPARAGERRPSGSRAAAVSFFALLPIAVAIGVVVGRAGTGGEDNSAILQALREQNAATASAGTAAGATASTATKKNGAKDGLAKPTKGHGKVVAKTQYGTVHQVAGYHASKQTEDEGQKLVENNVEQTGSNYIQAQTNLPDVTVVGGNPDEAPALPTGGQP